jgi:hypothetical protein
MVLAYEALDKDDRKTFRKSALSDPVFEVHWRLLDRNRHERAEIKNVIDGAVNIDTTTEAGMWANLDVADSDDQLKADQDLLFLKRILQGVWQYTIPELGKVAVTGFTGPCTKCDHLPGGAIALEAQSMEFWLRGGIRWAKQWPKGAVVTDVMKNLLHIAGVPAKYVDLPDKNQRLGSPFQVVPLTGIDDDPDAFKSPLEALRFLADSLEADFLATRRGYFTVIPWDSEVVEELRGDESVIDPAQATITLGGMGGQANDPAQIRNRVIVIGKALPKKPVQGKAAAEPVIKGEWKAPDGTKYDVGNLGYPVGGDDNGHPTGGMELTEIYSNDQIHQRATAQRIADNRGRRYMQTGLQVGVTTLPTPWVERYQRVNLHTQDPTGNGDYDFLQASLGVWWSPENPQTVGFLGETWQPLERHRR